MQIDINNLRCKRVPSCVLFADKVNEKTKRALPAGGIDGINFSGTLKAHNCSLPNADKLVEEKNKYFYNVQGSSSAFSSVKRKKQEMENPYKSLFRQGATIVPRMFYFVKLNQDTPPDFEDRILNIKTSENIQQYAKAPWKGIELAGQIESRFLFRTALAKSILPFALYKPDFVVLPVLIEEELDGKKKINLCSSSELMQEGYLHASKWFRRAEEIWNLNRTEKNKEYALEDYLNWQNKLTSQNLNAPYVVIYNASGKDANSIVLNRTEFDLNYFVDYTSYCFYPNSLNEAFYLTAILNSSILNEGIKDFQSKGHFGARHVSRKILDIYFPHYDGNNPQHKELAELSKASHDKANCWIKDNPPQQELTSIHLGRLRTALKKHLSPELKQINVMIKHSLGL